MDLIIPVSVLENLPAEQKIRVSEAVPGSTTPQITLWWRLDNLLADATGNPISGWLAEQDLITTRHSPWEWEGFDFISETVCPADQLACHLDAQRLVSEVGLADYQAQISTADNGPVKTRLYDIIDGADGTTRDDKLTTAEIRAALGNPWHAQSISQLITHYESEWFWKAAKWDELDKLMEHTSADPNSNWVSEKERIQTLSWWGEMAGKHGISEDGMAWHFQPAGIVGNFAKKAKEWILGKTSERYESAGRGPGVVSTGRGDHGGVSYGTYQMSSTMGVVQKFIEISKYKDEFRGLTAATDDFNKKWKEIAVSEPDKFRKAQHDYIRDTHYKPQLDVLKNNSFPLNHDRAAIHDMIWSTSVQFGPTTRLIIRALTGETTSTMKDSEIITKVQGYKIENNERLFSSSPTLWDGLLNRAKDEKERLLELELLGAEIAED